MSRDLYIQCEMLVVCDVCHLTVQTRRFTSVAAYKRELKVDGWKFGKVLKCPTCVKEGRK